MLRRGESGVRPPVAQREGILNRLNVEMDSLPPGLVGDPVRLLRDHAQSRLLLVDDDDDVTCMFAAALCKARLVHTLWLSMQPLVNTSC